MSKPTGKHKQHQIILVTPNKPERIFGKGRTNSYDTLAQASDMANHINDRRESYTSRGVYADTTFVIRHKVTGESLLILPPK